MLLDAERKALNLLDETLVSLTTQEGSGAEFPITYANREETPPTKPYLQVQNLPIDRDDPTLGTLRIIQGIFQVSVIEAKGQGTDRARGIAAAIRDHFGGLTHIQSEDLTLSLYKQPAIRAPLHETDDMRVPVSIFYKTLA